MKKIKVLLLSSVMLIVLCIAGCGEEENDFGDTEGAASGTISIEDGIVSIDISDIEADVNSDIDYTSGIEIEGADDDSYVEIQADASEVDTTTEGTYEVTYTVTYEDSTYTDTSDVVISDSDSDSDSDNSSDSDSDSDSSTEVSDIESASIELLSGETVTISQTTEKYIVSTYTETEETERDGITYKISTLVIEFNTGETRILETVEAPVSE